MLVFFCFFKSNIYLKKHAKLDIYVNYIEENKNDMIKLKIQNIYERFDSDDLKL